MGLDRARVLSARPLAALLAAGALLIGSIGVPAVALAAAPANDNLASATQVTDLPFSVGYTLAEATLETGEPTPYCSYSSVAQTVWFDYTAESDGLVVVNSGNVYGVIAAYTGTDIGFLTSVGCTSGYYSPLYLFVTAGTTYHFQVANLYYLDAAGTFSLAVAPPPSVSVWVNPSDPSIYDQVSFNANVYDPANQPITGAWDFGDGATGSGLWGVTHSYAADGDYTVTITATTADGRTATCTQTLPVRTHDVVITKFDVPTSASSGQTRKMTVGVSNRRYSRDVQVQLFKSIPGGWGLVGTLTQFVQARAMRLTPFAFSYTFTTADAAIGKVNFKAEAVIPGVRDALPADNVAISLPTKVSK